MHNNKIQRLNRILKWMSAALAIVLVIAMVLLFFSPSPDADSMAQQSQRVSEEVTATVVQPKTEQNTSKSVRQNSVGKVAQSDITRSQSIVDNDFNQRVVNGAIVSTGDNSSLNLDLGNGDQIIVTNTSQQPKTNGANKSEPSQRKAVTGSQQSDPTKIPEEQSILGNKEIAGQVQDLRGQQVSSVSIQLRLQTPGPDAPDSSLSRFTESDSEGEFIFQNLADGDYRLFISEEDGYADISHITRAGVSDLILVLTDKNSVTIQGHVSDVNDQPLAGVSISIDGAEKVKTDQDGSYQIIDTFDINSNHRIVFFLDGYREVNAIVKISSNTILIDKQLQFKSQLKLTGQIIDDYGIPLPKAAIWLQSRSAEIERRTTSDDDGYFSVEDLKSGSDYQFTVSYSGHEKFSLSKQSITESSQPMRIELKALDKGTVAGTIVNTIGYPVSNYAMKILNNNGTAGVQIITSDNAGQFEVASVYAGVLQINSMAEPRSTISGIKLAAGQDMYVTLVVDQGDYEIVGRAIDDSGHAIPNAQIHLTWSHIYDGIRSNSNRRLQSDAQGNYRIQNVGSGAHTLMVSAAGYKTFRVNIMPDQQFEPLSIKLIR